jgi:hypothetical protein
LTENDPDRPSSPPPVRPPYQPAAPPPGWLPYPPAAPLFVPVAPTYYAPPDDPLISADYNGWWSRSFRLLKAVWREAALIQTLWVVPSVVLGAIFSFAVNGLFSDLTNTPDTAEPDWHPFVRLAIYLVPLALLSGLLAVLASLATFHLVVQAALGRPLSVPAALRVAVRRIPAYLGWGFVGGLATLAGFVCCILPGYYVSVVLTILPVVVLLERGRAVARCFRLFHARVGDALARLITMLGLSMVVGVVAQLLIAIMGVPFGVFSGDGVSEPALFAVSIAGLLLTAAIQLVLAPMHVTTYADMRARHEPFTTADLA